jgi:hypothetical protein
MGIRYAVVIFLLVASVQPLALRHPLTECGMKFPLPPKHVSGIASREQNALLFEYQDDIRDTVYWSSAASLFSRTAGRFGWFATLRCMNEIEIISAGLARSCPTEFCGAEERDDGVVEARGDGLGEQFSNFTDAYKPLPKANAAKIRSWPMTSSALKNSAEKWSRARCQGSQSMVVAHALRWRDWRLYKPRLYEIDSA